MKQFTVVLLRPRGAFEHGDYTPYGQDIYVALVLADDKAVAVAIAQEEVYEADQENRAYASLKPSDYNLCVLFEGHQDPKLFGWQTY